MGGGLGHLSSIVLVVAVYTKYDGAQVP